MKQIYKQGTKKHIAWHKRFSRRFWATILLVFLVLIAAAVIAFDLLPAEQDQAQPISKTTISTVTFDNDVQSTPYFSFEDSGKWRPDRLNGDGRYIFYKYLGRSEVVQHQLTIFVDRQPIPLDLASPMALPVETSGNRFTPRIVSAKCGSQFAKNEPLKVQPRIVGETTILCDPDATQYKVLIGQVGSDYNLKLRRGNGQQANYIIIYKSQQLQPDPMTILQVAKSFRAL